MNIGIVNLYEIYNIKNAIFNPLSYPIGEDLGYPLIHLKDELNRIGVSINTLDILPRNNFV